MAERPARSDRDVETSPDALEQRRRADGTFEEETVADPDDAPLDPDAWEQRQRHDGTMERPGALTDVGDAPLSADMIEQRQVVEYDEEDDRPVE